MFVRGGEMLEENGRCYMFVYKVVFLKMYLKMFVFFVYWKFNDVLIEEVIIWKELYKCIVGEWFCVVFLMVLIFVFYFNCLVVGWFVGICMFS